jgi:predicted CDP-diglyceride synthetase/phosphatidate cytidylyltransferase
MSYREKENILNIFSSLLITAVYAWIVYKRQMAGVIDLKDDFQQWGIVFLIFAGVNIVARIVIYIIFSIINAIATREGKIPPVDERDRLVKLKSIRNSHYSFSVGFFAAIIALSIGMPSYWLFILFVLSGVLSELIDNGSQMYYYRKGV